LVKPDGFDRAGGVFNDGLLDFLAVLGVDVLTTDYVTLEGDDFIWLDFSDEADLGEVLMAGGIMMEQVLNGEDVEFF